MTRQEFVAAAEALVGAERGTLTRVCRLCGFSISTVNAISQGIRPVPALYAERLRAEFAASQARGSLIPFVGARLVPVVRDVERAGWSEGDALAAIAAWAALGLSGAR